VSRPLRLAVTLAVTALCVAYILWKIDVAKTADILRDANVADFALASAIMIVTTVPMAWRWQQLLGARAIREPLSWLTRTYFIAYTANQVLPTSLGGDAVRIVEVSRRNPGTGGVATASVFLDRALGGIATVALGAVGFALAVGRYDINGYLWLEGLFIVATVALGFLFFSSWVRRHLARFVPLARRLRIERPARAVYEGIHAYRNDGRLLLWLAVVTLGVQVVRILPIWLCARAVGIDLSVRPFYVMGPILFIVLLFPFTINGIGVREAFFVSFLGALGVSADHAFAAGFLFFLVTVTLALPGLGILLWEGMRGAARPGLRRSTG
jgi:glycosyltransferase 2 family protein